MYAKRNTRFAGKMSSHQYRGPLCFWVKIQVEGIFVARFRVRILEVRASLRFDTCTFALRFKVHASTEIGLTLLFSYLRKAFRRLAVPSWFTYISLLYCRRVTQHELGGQEAAAHLSYKMNACRRQYITLLN